MGSAWGSKWPCLNEIIHSRKTLQQFCNNNKWILNKLVKPDKYYQMLASLKYFICPIGNGLQSPKIFEALLCKTVPIMEDIPVSRQIKQFGFPIMIVNSWKDITQETLIKKYNEEFINIMWDEIHYKLSNNGMKEHLINVNNLVQTK